MGASKCSNSKFCSFLSSSHRFFNLTSLEHPSNASFHTHRHPKTTSTTTSTSTSTNTQTSPPQQRIRHHVCKRQRVRALAIRQPALHSASATSTRLRRQQWRSLPLLPHSPEAEVGISSPWWKIRLEVPSAATSRLLPTAHLLWLSTTGHDSPKSAAVLLPPSANGHAATTCRLPRFLGSSTNGTGTSSCSSRNHW